MRLAGKIPEALNAASLVDFLYTQGIASRVERDGDHWQFWIYDEDQLPRGREELTKFLASPDDPRYREASTAADRLRNETVERELAARRNVIEVSHPAGMNPRGNRPLTMTLLAGMAFVFVMSDFGKNDAVFRPLLLTNFVGDFASGTALPEIRNGEWWRLFSSIFIHFHIAHFLFNAMGLVSFGSMIETLRGTFRFAILVAFLDVTSGLFQFWWDGGGMAGGMSGVLYGLFGYIWMKAWFEPRSGFVMQNQTIVIMHLWHLLCMGGYLGSIANAAHVSGQIVGMLIGYAPTLWRIATRRG